MRILAIVALILGVISALLGGAYPLLFNPFNYYIGPKALAAFAALCFLFSIAVSVLPKKE